MKFNFRRSLFLIISSSLFLFIAFYLSLPTLTNYIHHPQLTESKITPIFDSLYHNRVIMMKSYAAKRGFSWGVTQISDTLPTAFFYNKDDIEINTPEQISYYWVRYQSGKTITKLALFNEHDALRKEILYGAPTSSKVRSSTEILFKNGIKESCCEYLGSEKHGQEITYFPNGKIQSSANWLNGKQTGKYLEYFSNGNISVKGYYNNNKRTGEWYHEYDNGYYEIERQELVRVGAICRDGWESSATGRGACSWHGGVDYWLYDKRWVIVAQGYKHRR